MLERLALVLVVAAAAYAQEPAPKAEEDPNVLLSLALRRLETAENVAATVDVKQQPAEQSGPVQGQGAGGMVIVQTQVLGEHEPFEGRVEAYRDADGHVVMVSESELPGFALYVGEGRTIERTTVEDIRFSLDQLKGELAALLDEKAFAQRIFDAKLAPQRDATTGEITFSGKVEKDIVPPTGGEMAFIMAKRVLDVEATLVVKPDGHLRSAAIKITRSDPTREMMRGGQMRQIVIGPGGPVPAPPDGDDKKHDIVGGSTTYTLSFREGGLSPRAKAFKEEVERILRPAEVSVFPPGRGGDEEHK